MRTLRFGRQYLIGLSLAVILVLSAHFAMAQANRATVTGTVTDTSGAIVPEVEITATNLGTGVPAKTVSNQDGVYVIPNLFPGQYSLDFKRDGFETVRYPTITLESTQVARIDAALKVGAVKESVTVTSDAPVLDLEKPSEGTNMNGKIVTDLPLSIYNGGRFVENFAVAITPGYSPISSPYNAVVNGGQYFTKDYTIDGTSGTTNIRGDSMEAGPTMEAVQELQAETSGLDAQSAITGGGVMSFNLKSGTNRWHGSGFLYGHNELLDANTWTNDYAGIEKPQERAWDWGGSLGGPIIKDKTFFFAAFERYQQVDFRLNGGSASVPTTKMLGGDFSQLLGGELCTGGLGTAPCSGYPANQNPTPLAPVQNDAGQTVQPQVGMIYDPATGNQFTGNVIPSNLISPTAQRVNAFYKNYAPQFGGINNNARGLIQNTPSQTPNQVVVKIDHNLREQDHLSGSWIYNHRPRTLDDSGGVWEAGTTNGGPLSNGRVQIYRDQQWRLSESHTFSPSILNVLNFTYNFDFNSSAPSDPGNWNSQLGFGNTGANTFPLISFTDNPAYGYNETFLGGTWQGNFSGVNITTGDTVTWTKGRHNFSFGGDFIAHQINSRSGSGALSFDFSYLTTAGAGYPYDGFGFASYLLGKSDKASEAVPYNLYGRQKELALFAQDSYKATPRLTLNAGLRWNYNFRFHEKYGRWANFDPTVDSSTYGIPGALVFAHGGGDSFEKNEYAKNFGPSIGFAYQMRPKTVLRGSYGLIFNPVGVAYYQGVPNGFAPQLGVNNATNFNWDGPGGTGNYPGVLTTVNANTDPTLVFPEVTVDPRALRLGYSEAFNLGIQQQLTPNTRLEVSYIGNRGHRLTDTSLAWNQGPTSTFLRLAHNVPYLQTYYPYVCSPADAAAYGITYPTYKNPTTLPFCAPLLAAIAPLQQMAASEAGYWFYANQLYVGLPLGQSFYDSLVANVVKRTGRGLTMDLSYTWSRQEGDTYSSEQETNGYYTGIEDFSNMRGAAHAVTGYDLTHVVKGFVSYELPFGRGRQWPVSNRFLDAVVGGWMVTGMITYYTGQPFEVGAANPYWPLWGDVYPQFNVSGFAGPSSPRRFVPVAAGGTPPASNFYMPTSVASNPAAGILPPSPSTSALRCPGQANENASLLKNFNIGSEGQYRLSFRTEFYNLLNRHYYYIQGCDGSRAGIGSPDFGQVLSVLDNPRQGQFAIRFDF